MEVEMNPSLSRQTEDQGPRLNCPILGPLFS